MALTARSLEALRVPTRGIYSKEKNTIRKLFPRPLDGHNFSVLVETQDLNGVFDGATRSIGERVVGDEDTDIVAFLKAHLHPPAQLAGVEGGYFTLRLKEAMANPASVGVLLGIARFPQAGIHHACRLHNPKWLPKLTAIAARIYPQRMTGSKTLGEMEAATANKLQPTHTVQVVDEPDSVEHAMVDGGITSTAAEVGGSIGVDAPSVEGVAQGEDSAGHMADAGVTSSGDGAFEREHAEVHPDSAVSQLPHEAPSPGLAIEMLHIEECASPLRYRKYLEPLLKRRRKPQPLPKGIFARKAMESCRRSAVDDGTGRATAARRGGMSNSDGLEEQATKAVQTRERDKGHRLSVIPPSNVLTRRQLRALQAEQDTAPSSPVPEEDAPNDIKRRERRAAAQQRQHRDAKRQQREHTRPAKPMSQSTSDQPPIFHVVDDEPGKRPRSLFLRPENEKKRKRKPRVIVIN